MKKVFLILCANACFSFTSEDDFNDCPENSRWISSSCASGCYSVYYMVPGNILASITPHRPSDAQATAIRNDLNRRCSSISGQANILDPGTIR